MNPREAALARLTAPGAPFEIGLEDVLGEPLPVYTRRHRSLVELLRASERFADREYLVSGSRRITFAEHSQGVAALAAALRDDYGVGTGDRVAIHSANNPEWIIAFWAAVSLGAIAVGTNAWWAPPELDHGLRLTDPAVLISDRPFPSERPVRSNLSSGSAVRSGEDGGDGCAREDAERDGVAVLSIEHDVPRLIQKYAGAALPEVSIDEDDPAVILFTSGTTGRAKGVTHSHRNVLAACWYHLLGDALATELGFPPADRRFLLISPLFHIAALHNLAVPRLAVGDTAVLYEGRFDAEKLLGLIERERITNWGAVPTLLARLVERPDLDRYDLSPLRALSVNSAPSSAALKRRVREAFPHAAPALTTSYGLTESSTAATVAVPAELAADPDTVGAPIPTVAVSIRDTAGQPVPEGTEGEICLRGAQLMLGYWRDRAATEAATLPGGWFRTGDLGSMSGGRLRMSTRRTDLILRGGENVYPAEVEEQLGAHAAVAECVVLGLPHDDLGQEVAAVVVARPGASVTEDALRGYLLERLARYKVPSRWAITTDPLPRTPMGKVRIAAVKHALGSP